MKNSAVFKKYPQLALIGNTPLVKINLFEKECPNISIYVKCEYTNPGGSLKDRPVRQMLLKAIESGKLTPDKTILDSSSGNAGIAYAAIGAMLNFSVELIIPGNASVERKKRIRAHGATLIETDPALGYDEVIREANRRFKANPEKYYKPNQYDNENNWRAHFETTAREILEQVPEPITHFVAGCGTGGTFTGCGRRLKEKDKLTQLVFVSVKDLSGIEGLKPLSPGSIIPGIFDATLIDQKVSVNMEQAAGICKRLALHGFFVGQSSGAYLYAAYQTAKTLKKGCIVTLLNDIGERYFSTQLWN